MNIHFVSEFFCVDHFEFLVTDALGQFCSVVVHLLACFLVCCLFLLIDGQLCVSMATNHSLKGIGY